MRSRWYLWGLFALMVLAPAGPLGAQPPLPFAWWKHTQFQKGLGLTADQSNRIEVIFQTALAQLRHQKNELDALEAEFSRLVEADADDQAIAKQADRVEAARGSLNKTRTLMIVHMRQVLSTEQRAKFGTLSEQWKREHRGPPRRDGAK